MIAIAADAVDDTARLQARLPGLRLLTDPSMSAPAAWGLRIGAAEAPWPATFVVDDRGTVAWRHLGVRGADWPTWDALAAALAM